MAASRLLLTPWKTAGDPELSESLARLFSFRAHTGALARDMRLSRTEFSSFGTARQKPA
jgi:hypothetical protein